MTEFEALKDMLDSGTEIRLRKATDGYVIEAFYPGGMVVREMIDRDTLLDMFVSLKDG